MTDARVRRPRLLGERAGARAVLTDLPERLREGELDLAAELDVLERDRAFEQRKGLLRLPAGEVQLAETEEGSRDQQVRGAHDLLRLRESSLEQRKGHLELAEADPHPPQTDDA